MQFRNPTGVVLRRRAAGLTCAVATSATVACAWWFGLREPPTRQSSPSPEERRHIDAVMAQSLAEAQQQMISKVSRLTTWREMPLAVGDPLPCVDAAGWINGPAVTLDDLQGRVVVVDVWNDI